MLHEVLEEEARASEPIPDPLLPFIVAFIQEFGDVKLEVFAACARKTELALWRHLFNAIGSPIQLFQECLELGKVDVASSYLVILQNLEPSAPHHASELLEAALAKQDWCCAAEIVRFIRAIASGDNPPSPGNIISSKLRRRTLSGGSYMTHSGKLSPSHRDLQTVFSFDKVDGGEKPDKPNEKLAPTEGPIVVDGASKKSPEGSKADVTPDQSRRNSLRRSSFASSADADVEYIEEALCRHVRHFLRRRRIRNIGVMAAYLNVDLVSVLRKERHRSARIGDFPACLVGIHEEFHLCWPDLGNCAKLPASFLEPHGLLSATPLDASTITRDCSLAQPTQTLSAKKKPLNRNATFDSFPCASPTTFDEMITPQLNRTKHGHQPVNRPLFASSNGRELTKELGVSTKPERTFKSYSKKCPSDDPAAFGDSHAPQSPLSEERANVPTFHRHKLIKAASMPDSFQYSNRVPEQTSAKSTHGRGISPRVNGQVRINGHVNRQINNLSEKLDCIVDDRIRESSSPEVTSRHLGQMNSKLVTPPLESECSETSSFDPSILAPVTNPQSEAELRYLTRVFLKAGCLDWAVAIAVALRDASLFSEVVNTGALTDTATCDMQLLEAWCFLELWVRTECPGYGDFLSLCQPFFGRLREVMETSRVKDEAIVSPVVSQPQETVERESDVEETSNCILQ